MEDQKPSTSEAVLEFLGSIPLLQRLPSSLVKKIAQAVKLKEFDKGQYLVHEGEDGDGLYFIWKGEAEVSSNSETGESGLSELLLRHGDFFGSGCAEQGNQTEVMAVSKVICFVLDKEHLHLLSPESIWDATKDAGSCPEVELILQLENLEGDIFRGFTLSNAPRRWNVYGGQLVSQALAAAGKTVSPLMLAHSLHSYFIRAGDYNLPIIYNVQRARDGKNFATRQIEAVQRGQLIFTMFASFKTDEDGFEHHKPMPVAPDPDSLLPRERIMESYVTDPRLPISFRNILARENAIPMPIEYRPCERLDRFPYLSTKEPRQMYWFRARGSLSDDPALHRCVAAYASDFIFLETGARPHQKKGESVYLLSLDHSMWFHKSFRADEWLLFEVESPIASSGRSITVGHIYNKSGEIVVSVTQEGLVRKMQSKL